MSRGASGPSRRVLQRPVGVAVLLLVVVAAVALAPDPVPLGGSRLLVRAALVAGAAVTVARAGAVDLGVAAVAGVGAVCGGVLVAVADLPALLGVPVGAVAGATLGAVTGAVQGRTGRVLGALATLALASAVVRVLSTLDVVGGVGGFHAVGLPTGRGDRIDAAVVGVTAVGIVLVAATASRTRWLAAAGVGTSEPTVAAALGRSPVRDVARAGAVGGGCIGAAAALLASVDGSVVPAAYGLELAAALVVAAAVGGAGPLGPVLGALLIWGPATVFPLAPVVGTLPVLVTAGPLALALLALRRGRPLTAAVPSATRRRAAAAIDPADRAGADRAGPDRADPDRADPGRADPDAVLTLGGTSTPSGPLDLAVRAGEVVALIGPNGAGKSTVLARIAGQLPDGGTIAVGGRALPRGARRRARAGVARTWQRPPVVAVGDLAAAQPAWDTRAANAATDHLGTLAETPGGAQLVRLAAAAPRVALLDEPTDVPPHLLVPFLREVAAAGAAVLVVDHRPEVVVAADRQVQLSPVATEALP